MTLKENITVLWKWDKIGWRHPVMLCRTHIATKYYKPRRPVRENLLPVPS